MKVRAPSCARSITGTVRERERPAERDRHSAVAIRSVYSCASLRGRRPQLGSFGCSFIHAAHLRSLWHIWAHSPCALALPGWCPETFLAQWVALVVLVSDARSGFDVAGKEKVFASEGLDRLLHWRLRRRIRNPTTTALLDIICGGNLRPKLVFRLVRPIRKERVGDRSLPSFGSMCAMW